MKKQTTLMRKLKSSSELLLILILFLSANLAQAQIPNIIPYQGQISDTSGKAFDGNYDFSFRILNSGGTSLWSSGTLNLEVFKGGYSVHLGESPQTPLPSDLMSNDILFLEVSFDDGTNGIETLAPDVQILPVPYALRAVIADSATNTNGQLAWGDSLVLRDASGDIRFVINPNTGEFRAMQKDTTWYQLEVNSPAEDKRAAISGGMKGGFETKNGAEYHTLTFTRGSGSVQWKNYTRVGPPEGRFDTIAISKRWDKNGCQTYYSWTVRDTLLGIERKYVRTFKCPGGSILTNTCTNITGPAIAGGDFKEDSEEKIRTENKSGDGKEEESVEDQRTGNKVKVIKDAKDSCLVVEAKKIVLKNGDLERVISITEDGKVSNTAEDKGSAEMILIEELERIAEGLARRLTVEEELHEAIKALNGDSIKVKYLPNKGEVDWEGIDQFWLTNEWIRYVTKMEQGKTVGVNYDQVSGDSLKKIVNPKAGSVEFEGIDQFWLTNEWIRYVNKMEQGKTVEVNYDRVTNDSVKRIIETGKGLERIEGISEFWKTNAWIRYVSKMEQGKTVGVNYDQVSKDSIKKTAEPKERRETTEGVILDINQILKNDTFHKIFEVIDGGSVQNRSALRFVPSDSLLIYDGNDNVVRRVGPEGSKETHKYDAITHVIEETNRPIDSTRRIVGVANLEYDGNDNIVRRNKSGEMESRYEFDGAPNRSIREITSPKDSSKLYVDVRQIQFQGTQDVSFVYQGTSNTSFVAHDPNNKLVVHGGIKNAEWDFDSAIAALNNDGTRVGLNFTNPRTNNQVGLGFDPDGRAVILQGNGKAIFVGDTLVAQDKVMSSNLEINGNGLITGNLNVLGNISKGGGTFKIDHPNDPYNKYLYHSFIESPDMMNVYNGNITTDSFGFDTVTLPDYFKSLNRDFRYQLTCIGTFAQAIIVREIENNQFVIQTNKPNVKVSWQVTGIRKDNFANDNRVKVEVEKQGKEKGTLLYPPKVKN